MYCSYCGKKIQDGSNFCFSCGKETLKQKTENELSEFVKRAKTGDRDAITVLYEKTYTQVFYTVKSMIKDEDAVFDILQDAYMKAFAHLDSFKGDDKFLPWVKQIAANTARDWLKRKKPLLFSELNTDEDQDMKFEEQIEDDRDENIPEKFIDQQEMVRIIREIIDNLPEDQRASIGMYYYDGMSVKEIAAAMGASESAVKSRLKYGRDKIEAKVIELEKNGTKLYGIAPFPFWLLLMNSLKNYAPELSPNVNVLKAVLESIVKTSATGATIKTAGDIAQTATETSKTAAGTAASTATGGAAATGAVGTATTASATGATGVGATASKAATAKGIGALAAGIGGLGATKIAVIVLLSSALIGGSVFGVTQLIKLSNEQAVEATLEEDDEEPKSKESSESEESSEESTVEISPQAEALEQYKLIISNAAGYDYYNGDFPLEGNYKYALVKLQENDSVQTLLLGAKTVRESYYIRVFRYDPGTKTVHQPAEVIDEGMVSRSVVTGVNMMADGNGIHWISTARGDGETTLERVTLDGDVLRKELVYTGGFDAELPAEFKSVEIEWHSTQDLSAIDRQLSSLSQDSQVPQQLPPATEIQVSTQATLPTDGDRIVLTGTINDYDYNGVIKVQGEPDPNGSTDRTERYIVFVLDKPQVMNLEQGDDSGEKRSDEVRMIYLGPYSNLGQYYGKHITVSVDPDEMMWPSDTRMPLGQPSGSIRVLN
jgi:RNA polymerase sigma factor, sigma-70 family